MKLTIEEEGVIHVNKNKINITTYQEDHEASLLLNKYLPVPPSINNITLTDTEAIKLAALLLQAVDKKLRIIIDKPEV